MFEGQNPYRIRRLKGNNIYQISNVHRSITPDSGQSQYCDRCEVRELCHVEGNPPIIRKISLTEVLIARCQKALQRFKGMIIPVTDRDFSPTIIAGNVIIPCLDNKASDPYPDVKEVRGNYWWQEQDKD